MPSPEVAAMTITAPRDARPIDEALGYVADRLDRVEHMLGVLQGTIQRTGTRLEPVLTSGAIDYAHTSPTKDVEPTPEDLRSTVARRISGHAIRADRLADLVGDLDRDLEAILDALEV